MTPMERSDTPINGDSSQTTDASDHATRHDEAKDQAVDPSPHGVSALLHRVLTTRFPRVSGAGEADLGGELLGQHLNNLNEKLQLVLAEHEGMGNELLHAYEQLGVVFDITRRLASATDEDGVVPVFVECLRAIFNKCCFGTVCLDPKHGINVCLWDSCPVTRGAEDNSRRIKLLADESAGVRRVVVQDYACSSSPRSSCDCLSQAMACPIYAGDDLVCVLMLMRQEDFRKFTSADMLLMDSLGVFCGDIIRKLRLMHELRQMSIDMVRALVETIDQKDVYTSGHSTRVGYYARLLAEGLGWSDERLQILEWAALLHDVGKIGIRDEVLKKAGKLTSEEFDHMKEHPVRSSEVVCRIPQLAEAVDGVLYHHEHWDGGGYPDGLVGEDIPLQARIIQIADIFDALTTSRSYRKAFVWQKALSILREEAGVVVDPNLAAMFDKLILDWAARNPEGFSGMFEVSVGGTARVPLGASPTMPEIGAARTSPSTSETTLPGEE